MLRTGPNEGLCSAKERRQRLHFTGRRLGRELLTGEATIWPFQVPQVNLCPLQPLHSSGRTSHNQHTTFTMPQVRYIISVVLGSDRPNKVIQEPALVQHLVLALANIHRILLKELGQPIIESCWSGGLWHDVATAFRTASTDLGRHTTKVSCSDWGHNRNCTAK